MNQSSPSPSFFRIRNLVFLIVFFVVLLLPAFEKLPPPSDFQAQPGKFLTAHPLMQAYWSFTQLPEKYQDYFANNFFLRKQGVTANDEILFRLGNSIFPNALVGKEGWLYLTDEDNLSYYQCDQPFTQEELDRIVKNVESMQGFSRKNGAEFLLLIAPNKESIYPEFLPAGIGTSGKACRMDQAIGALRSAGLDVIDLREPLRAAKPSGQLYYRTDTHWNDAGAFLAYQIVASELEKAFPALDTWSAGDFRKEAQVKSGDLSNLVPLVNPLSEEAEVLQPVRERKAQIRQGDGEKTIISEAENPANPNAVVFRDSFFMGLLPFFAENFNHAVYRWSTDFDENLIATEKPDLVIYELAERYLGTLAR